MKQALALGLSALSLVLGACSSDPPPEEPKGSTESHLGASDCVQSAQGAGPVGSAEWRAALQQCTSDAANNARGGVPAVPNVPAVPGNGNGGGAPGVPGNTPGVPGNIPDVPDNGGGGGVPNIPNIPGVPGNDNGGDPGGNGGQIPNVPNLPDWGNWGGGVPGGGGGGAQGQSCINDVSCTNGTCTCGSGPNQGQTCDGSGNGANSCSSLCHYCQ
jgi:hypothetical protein